MGPMAFCAMEYPPTHGPPYQATADVDDKFDPRGWVLGSNKKSISTKLHPPNHFGSLKKRFHIFVVTGQSQRDLYIPGTQMTSIFEGQSFKTRPFPSKTRVIWVLGIHIYIYIYSDGLKLRMTFRPT